MDKKTKTTHPATGKSLFRKVYDFLSGFHLATVTLLLLLLLTWLATLEQIDHGLYPTLNKYFSWKSWYLIPDMVPEINGKKLPIFLPGGYYVCALLLVNMILGGIIRIRKGPKQIGNLISHFGIIFMLLGGGVAHHFSERGNMAVSEGETSNVAEDYHEYVIEVSEVKDGEREEFHVVRGEHLTDLKGGKSRIFDIEGIPFSLEISGYLVNSVPSNQLERPRQKNELVADGYYLEEMPGEVETERNFGGCYARVIFEGGEKSDPFIMAGASFYPFTVRDGDRVFTIDMRKRLWVMPFEVKLDTFTADFHPGTSQPAKFVSDIRRLENGQESKLTISMNEPMRYEGLTFFQASYGPQGAKPGDPMYSVFEVVRNPADKWPEYSLYVVAFGMLVTFLTKLGGHLGASSRKRKNAE
ncbi:MAG: cytochrome c biogenesis protein ResB [Akkermansiaceae bacterium]|nr:cytochrome c biogenesis protein ResB [Akkermansiaceae bacterium]